MKLDPDALCLESERLILRVSPNSAAAAVADYFARNQEHHAPTDPPRPAQFLEAGYWRGRLAANRAECWSGSSLRLFLFRRSEPLVVIGCANFTGVARGSFLACRLGYSLDEALVGQGYMSEGLRVAIAFVFGPMGLHRIEANHLLDNVRSARLLQRLGFRVEGEAKSYLFIAGAWRDHVLNSLTNPDCPPPG